MYEKQMVAGWGDMDYNQHMRNTAYLDKAADVRMMFFAEHGFPSAEFARHQIGPVIRRDELEYFHEVDMLSPVKVTLNLAGLSADGSRFLIRNEFFRADGKLAARIISLGGWLDLVARRLTPPPEGMAAAIRAMPRAESFQVI